VWGLGFRVERLDSGCRVSGSGFRGWVQGGFRVLRLDLGCRVEG